MIALYSGITYGLYSAFIMAAQTQGVWADWMGTLEASSFLVVFILPTIATALNDLFSAVWAFCLPRSRASWATSSRPSAPSPASSWSSTCTARRTSSAASPTGPPSRCSTTCGHRAPELRLQAHPQNAGGAGRHRREAAHHPLGDTARGRGLGRVTAKKIQNVYVYCQYITRTS